MTDDPLLRGGDREDDPPVRRGIDPQRLLRVAGLTREVLDEARRITPDATAIDHLRRVHQQITNELREALPPELFHELDLLTPEIRGDSLEELALAHAEILGWLEGLFQGTQLAIQVHALAEAEEEVTRRKPPRREGREPERGGTEYL